MIQISVSLRSYISFYNDVRVSPEKLFTGFRLLAELYKFLYFITKSVNGRYRDRFRLLAELYKFL